MTAEYIRYHLFVVPAFNMQTSAIAHVPVDPYMCGYVWMCGWDLPFIPSISQNQQVPRGLAWPWLRDTSPASGRTFPIHT